MFRQTLVTTDDIFKAKDAKDKDSKTLEFNISEGLVFEYSYSIAILDEYRCVLSISMDCKQINKNELHREFQVPLPQGKMAIIKMIGAWTRDHIWKTLSSNKIPDDMYGGDMWGVPHKDPVLKKLKSYTYLRSKKIGSVLGGTIYREWLEKTGIHKDEMYEIEKLAFRLNPTKNMHGSQYFDVLYRLKATLTPDVWSIVKSDMSKYNTSLCKWIMDIISSESMYQLTREQYCNIIKDSPDIVKKCRYGFRWDSMERAVLDTAQIPQNRWQWFVLRTSLTYEPHMWGVSEKTNDNIKKCLNKISSSDIGMWHYYKRAYHITQPYSFKRIVHMLQIISDGARIHEQQKDNVYSIPFVSVEGSPMRMLRNAIYNHRQEQELKKKHKLQVKDYTLPNPPIQLPEWMEKIRIKTAHDMIKAGVECEHCIGSYANSTDLFFRHGNVCAQVFRSNLQIGQCYDARDQITVQSKELKRKLDKALKPIREEMSNAE
jgi:hypothetical protein